MPRGGSELWDFVHEHVRRVAAAREAACEAALQSGCYGVLETMHGDGSVTFDLSPDVPYGCLHVRGPLHA